MDVAREQHHNFADYENCAGADVECVACIMRDETNKHLFERMDDALENQNA